MTLDTRASDDDRQRVVELLQEHTAVGRLTLEEFTDRVDNAYSARTLRDLAVVTSDLPPLPEKPGRVHRDLLVIFAIAAVTLLLLGLYMAVTR
ncbi:DUF1707 SHOCT-like domain-containing protein [Asanoa siamensis]|uniref:DUF1707 domain-containing protein n=1 Tax=Asanoa siamensis TaxID=926357 RepID=A0ABQ4CPL6_9ACTN|nr:DUF1707 domain-containing protein [Asanoa siamensis]GIF72938.1 hypothetical protein Asi02nite_24560 [Asanoa siamensis]